MRFAGAGSLAVLLVLGCPKFAHPESITSWGLTTGFEAGDAPRRAGSSWVAPSLSLDGARVALTLEGRVLGASFGVPQQAARLRLATMLSDRGWLRPELLIAAAGNGRASGVRQSIRAHLAGASSGFWISASSEASVGGEVRASLHLPLMGFGAWARSRNVWLSGAVEQNMGYLRATTVITATSPPDTGRGEPGVGVGDAVVNRTFTEPRKVMLSTAYASARWDGERIELESIGGITFGALTPPRRWAQARAAWRFTPHLALVATAGSRSPQYFALDPTGERQAALALRYSQATSFAPRVTLASRAQVLDCRIRRVGEGLCRVSIKAPGARLVELQGDPTLWEPMALRPMSGERWEAELPMGPGVHRIGLRIDGGPWVPPPGLPTAPDGFGGSIGVAVIEQ